MTRITRRAQFALAVVALAALATPSRARAQENDGSASVTVVLMASLPPGARVVVQRGHGGRSRNLILLTEGSTALDLATGLDVLRALRARDGEEVDRARRVSIGATDEARVLRPARLRELESQLQRLRTAQARDVSDLGSVRAIVIVLPTVPRRAGSGG